MHPILLGVGLAAVAIPIAVHLLMRRRRRPVRWAAMRFLLEAYKRKQRRLRLEQLLLLAARCLLLALIALAVGRPMMSRAGALGAGARDLHLLIDNSLASALTDEAGVSALNRSVERALALLGELDGARGDRAALVLLGGEPQTLVFPPTSDLGQVERRLREIGPTDAAMDLAGGLGLIAALEVPEEVTATPVVAVLSEFREGSLGGATVLPALDERFGMIASEPAAAPRANIGIAGAELLRPVVLTGGAEGAGLGASGQIRVRLMRTGAGVDRGAATSVRVVREDGGTRQEAGASVVEWTPGEGEAQTTIDLSAGGSDREGRAVLRVEIDPDANERDNAAWAVLDVRERLRVAVIGTRRFGARPAISDFGPTDWVALALRPGLDPDGAELDVEVLDGPRVEGGQLAGFDAVVIAEPDRLRPAGWQAVGAFGAGGGAVVLLAAPLLGAQLWIEDASEALGLPWEIDLEPVAMEDVGIEVASAGAGDLLWYLRGELEELAGTVRVERALAVRSESDGDVLLRSGQGSPLLLSVLPGSAGRPAGGGVVTLLATAADLAWTDLPARPLMVPLMQELVRSGVGRAASGDQAVAGARLAMPRGAVELRGAGREGGEHAVDPATGRTREAVRRAGVYEAVDGAGRVLRGVTVQPDASAGRAQTADAARVGAWLGTALASPDRLAWGTEAAAGTDGGAEAAPRPSDAGPGLALLAAAAGLACVELWLARLVSHAARPAAASGGEAER